MATSARFTVMILAAAWLVAASEAAAQRGGPLEQATELARNARSAGDPADRTAATILSTLNLSRGDVLRALREGGYAAEETAMAATTLLAMPVVEAVTALVTAGYPGAQAARWFGRQDREPAAVMEGLRRAGADAREATRDVVQAGFDPDEAVLALRSVYGRSATETAAALRYSEVGSLDAAGALRWGGWGCDEVAVAMRESGYELSDVQAALLAEFGPIPGRAGTPSPDGAPRITSFVVNGGEEVVYSRQLSLSWEALGCAPTHVRVSELPSFGGSTWYSLTPAPTMSGTSVGSTTYTLAQDTPGQKSVYLQLRNPLGDGVVAAVSFEYHKLLRITDVRLNQGEATTNKRALSVEVAFDGAAPTHIRMAEENLEQRPWQAFGDLQPFFPEPGGYPISRSFLLQSPGHGAKTVWVQLMRDDENTLSDPVSAQIEYGSFPRLVNVGPAEAVVGSPALVPVEVTGLATDVASFSSVTMTGGGGHCTMQGAGGGAASAHASATTLDDETWRFTFEGVMQGPGSACQVHLAISARNDAGQSLPLVHASEPATSIALQQPAERKLFAIDGTTAWEVAHQEGFEFYPVPIGDNTVTVPRDGVDTRLQYESTVGGVTIVYARVAMGQLYASGGSIGSVYSYRLFAGRDLAPGWVIKHVMPEPPAMLDVAPVANSQTPVFQLKIASPIGPFAGAQAPIGSVVLEGPADGDWRDAFRH